MAARVLQHEFDEHEAALVAELGGGGGEGGLDDGGDFGEFVLGGGGGGQQVVEVGLAFEEQEQLAVVEVGVVDDELQEGYFGVGDVLE
jgi:hypothetical protein